MTYPKERELPDDYPIYAHYLYVVDNRVWRAPWNMTAAQLKKTGGFNSVKNCDIAARNLWSMMI